MSANVLTIEQAKSANLTLVDSDSKGRQAVHDVVVALQANRRSGTANVKTRAEVAGTGKKPWRQKGTGRARHGDMISPIYVGGGVAHGPKPRSYAKSVNRRIRALALSKVLTERIKAGDVLVADQFAVADGKTRSFVAAIREFGESPRVLIIGHFDGPTFLAARNVQPALLMSPEEVNVEHLLRYNRIVITQDAFETLARRTARS